jgi:hypothetical protein
MLVRTILLIAWFNCQFTIELLSQNNKSMNKTQKLNKNEVASIIKEFNGQTDRSILNSVPTKLSKGEEFYRLNDDRILFRLAKGDGIIYSSLQEIIDIFSTDHVSKIPQVDETFLPRIEAYIKQLRDTLKLDLSMLDKLDDLQRLDSAIMRKGGISSINEKDHLLSLVAYCGQIIVNEVGGTWVVNRVNNEKPKVFIKDNQGKLYDPYNPVLKEIIDASDDFSFAGVVYQLVKPFRLKTISSTDH